MELIELSVSIEELKTALRNRPRHLSEKIAQRLFLGSKGIQFKDDGKISAIGNENPEPKGTLVFEFNTRTKTCYVKQVIP
jgi:hypothetical protein